jgi:hypothetical protein
MRHLFALAVFVMLAACTLAAAKFIVVTTPAVPTGERPGPSLNLYNTHPYYTCVNNYYVSTRGSSSSNGSSGSPWDIRTASNQSLAAGSCINVAAGTYSLPQGSPASLAISNGGSNSTTTGYIVWRCSTMPFSFSGGALQGEGSGCVISQAAGNPDPYVIQFQPNANYIMFDGFELYGTIANQGNCFDNELGPPGTAGISHHIWLLNSDVHGCGQSGIQWWGNEWAFIIHNVWHDNSSTSCVMGSGLSIFEPFFINGYAPSAGNPDYWHSNTTGLTYHFIVNYNVGYHNYNPQGACGNTNTDGEGIILDDWSHSQQTCPTSAGITCPIPASAPALVMGNLMFNNGGNGIETFSWLSSGNPPATIVNNTGYSNNWDTYQASTNTWRGALSMLNSAYKVTWINNIGYAVIGTGLLASNSPFVGQGTAGSSTGNSWHNNLSYPGGANNFDNVGDTYPTTGVNKNLYGSDPKFMSITPNSNVQNFALQASSPAIGFGQAFDLWQQTQSVDAGACPHTFTSCP